MADESGRPAVQHECFSRGRRLDRQTPPARAG